MEDHSEQFKTPLDQFNSDLDDLEQYGNGAGMRDTLARMSLYKQFDPLVSAPKPTHQPPPPHTNETITNEIAASSAEHFNQSCTLIHINSPAAKVYENNSPMKELNTNGHVNTNEILDDRDTLQAIDYHENVPLLTSLSELLFDLAGDQLHSLQQQLSNSQKEEDRLNSIKNHLSEELNNVEKNYYDTHSRYENLRALVKEITDRERVNKEKILEFATKLKEKEQECRKWKQVAEDTRESSNQRLQQVNSKETVALKAQIKVLEMRVNSLQTQLDQKNNENQELSLIVDELIGKKN